MPRASIPISPQCVKLQEVGWSSSDLSDDDRSFQDRVRSLFYNFNDLKQLDNNRIEQLKLALQFDITGGDPSEQVIIHNVTIIGKDPANSEDKPPEIKPGEARYKFKCALKYDVVSTFATIRLRIGRGKSIFCNIEDAADGFIYFNPCDNSVVLNTRITYHVVFMPNDLSLCLGYTALKNIDLLMLADYFRDFDKVPFGQPVKSNSKPTPHEWDSWLYNFDWINKDIENNEEQKTAVQNIVDCKSSPFPFVVFGPPGTGKTTVLVEAVLQIMKRKPSSRVLITAQSNSACNEVCSRLIDSIPSNTLLRLFSRSTYVNEKDKIPSNIESVSDCSKNIGFKKFMQFKVIISTLVTSDQLKGKGRFDYIFIDECASASEPEALIPIVTLGASDSKITSNLILLGDHKQLGPVINSNIAEKLGLGVSLMERIMTKPRYEAYPDFNTDYVVQLLDNYRSHPAILQFSNKQFYDSKLRAKMSEDDQLWALGWKKLPNEAFPIMFHAIQDSSGTDSKGSSFNATEAIIIRTYITFLIKEGICGYPVTADNIGVVTPYTAQNQNLKEVLVNTGVEVGSTEYFQGREKEIIIMSTVRSQSSSVGFLKNHRRLNVMITRAKYLLIIIGNPRTLEMDPIWKALIDYCRDNNALWDQTGYEPSIETKEGSGIGVTSIELSE